MIMVRKILLSLLLVLLLSTPALARLNVVSTLPWIGSIAREIGKEKVDVVSLVKPSLDPHMVEAKPSMILAVRKADILLYNGLDLEIGYLPVLIESSRNPRVQPGQAGNFDSSQFITAIEKPLAADRSMGDVHALGNPHYHFSPGNIAGVVAGMAARFAQLDPANSGYYRANLEAFQKKLREKRVEWAMKPLKKKRYVAHHKLFEYLAKETGFEIIAYVEPKPGIPPSAAHIEKLILTMNQAPKPAGILTTLIYSQREADFLVRKTGVKKILLPHDVGATKEAKDWFGMMDQVFSALD